jgi:hypothetical protein
VTLRVENRSRPSLTEPCTELSECDVAEVASLERAVFLVMGVPGCCVGFLASFARLRCAAMCAERLPPRKEALPRDDVDVAALPVSVVDGARPRPRPDVPIPPSRPEGPMPPPRPVPGLDAKVGVEPFGRRRRRCGDVSMWVIVSPLALEDGR